MCCDACNCNIPTKCAGTRCQRHLVVPATAQHTCTVLLNGERNRVCGGPSTVMRKFGRCETCGCCKELQETVAAISETPDWVCHPARVAQDKFIKARELEAEACVHQWTKARRLRVLVSLKRDKKCSRGGEKRWRAVVASSGGNQWWQAYLNVHVIALAAQVACNNTSCSAPWQ